MADLIRTALKEPNHGLSKYKSAKVTKKRETLEVERGKPRKRETQILVGELLLGIKRCNGPI